MLPTWCRLVRADNPGPMTLEGTNTYVLSAGSENVVVDPGPLFDGHLRAVAALGPVAGTLLTHSHLDHSEAAGRFHEMTGAPVRAMDPRLCVDGAPLVGGATLEIAGLHIEVLHTPGHTVDSMSFVVCAGEQAGVLTGDTILGRGTTVVAHPDGRLGPYLQSLARLRELRSVVLLPGHGPVRPDVAAVAAEYLAHRRERLDQVRAALAAGARSPGEVVEIVYADVDPALWPAAELSVRAQLEYLTTESTG
ncbi:MAG TPA: MBL fold metallo-hydrolase [Jiangellaceae bacterium]|nr:MBL fold metallo-hydrolase [Jiangellaceae bacterium]